MPIKHSTSTPARARAAATQQPEPAAPDRSGAEEGSFTMSAAARDMLHLYLEDIASKCNILRQAGFQLVEDNADPVLCEAVTGAAAIAGWRADSCFQLIGESGPDVVGDWLDWIQSPAEQTARAAYEKVTGERKFEG